MKKEMKQNTETELIRSIREGGLSMNTIKLFAASGLKTLVILAIIVLVNYVLNKFVGTDFTLTSITFSMVLGFMWSYFYKEFETKD